MSLVSIITPTFNSSNFISQTIQSVLNQTHKNWEMIIVDDCSSDDTFTIISNFAKLDTRIKVFHLEQNSGAGVARNHAIQQAKGNFIAFLDADDLWKPEKLEKQINFMQTQNIPFTFSFYETIDEDGTLRNETITTPSKISFKQLYYCNWIGNLTGIYSVDFFGKIPISSIKKRQDWMLWLHIVKQIQIAYPVTESLAYYRVRKDSISASKWKLIRFNFKVYREFHQRNFISACSDTFRFLYVQLVIKPKYKLKI
ncbi:glycosyltransferase family 2 protein [Flavobacterium urocaniciphilum]|uniref:Glycosyltransferase involved in cell wall bisynthesis n=1 Tax=Flavobacterium urocaniciphilum TaxID=1299341 RepID=A0A1H9BMU5_9FLAO|nr:glycosyltransferase family 2 protein [Flavobacterium urocaniciphilum]SEP90215.1 Glycosyltransferase involved in cell wall bisynthesis [Flavobacterium urocaniciphilum]